ncbi:uncharacterized protein [Panulirus ornatus]|uniref:uncharacterized protein n=1 Tax=Panulirus ornatus TaxID=150431 RepID=UPI003A87B738
MGVLLREMGTWSWVRETVFPIAILQFLVATSVLFGVPVKVQGSTMEGVVLQSDGVPTRSTYILFKQTLPDLDAFTLCFRMSFAQFRQHNPFFSYAVDDNPNELYVGFNYELQHLEVSCCDRQVALTSSLSLPDLQIWHSACVSLRLYTGEWSIMWDDHVDNGTIDGLYTTVRGDGQLVIGQKQSTMGGGFNLASSLRGSLVDMRLYDSEISLNDMRDLINCQDTDYLGDPRVDFRNITDNFIFSDTQADIVEAKDICLFSKPYHLIFPEAITFGEAERLCLVSGGNLPEPQNEKENLELLEQMIPYSQKCAEDYSMGALWMGVRSSSWEDAWMSTQQETSLSYLNFMDPTVPPSQMCASIIISGEEKDLGKWQRTECNDFRCMACNYSHDSRVVWRLTGLCEAAPFDRNYVILEENLSIVLRGLLSSEIRLFMEDIDETHRYGYWRLKSHTEESAGIKLYRTSPQHFPFGVNEWQTENHMCGKTKIKLMLTKCAENEMTCRDSSCLFNKRYRCDMEVDCPDGSDEEDCNRIKIPESYKPEISPPRKDISNPRIVFFNIDLLSIKKFDITNFIFTSEVIVHFVWQDPRLTFLNLQSSRWKNKISTKIWEPSVEYLGSDETSCDVKERRRSLFAELEDSSYTEDKQEVLQDTYYRGDSNNVSLIQQLTIETGCQFELYAFPFDVQECNLTIALHDIPENVVMLEVIEPGVTFLGERYMLQYYLDNEEIFVHSQNEYSAVTLRLTFSNLSMYFISSTYVPTFLLLVIGYLTFYFPIDDFSDRIMVSLTALLVEAAFFTQTSQSIPQTAYLKLVDIWFVFCIVSLFVIMLCLVTINTLEENAQPSVPEEREDTAFYMNFKFQVSPAIAPTSLSESQSSGEGSSAKCCRRSCSAKLNVACQVVIPILLSVFLIVYFVTALDLIP